MQVLLISLPVMRLSLLFIVAIPLLVLLVPWHEARAMQPHLVIRVTSHVDALDSLLDFLHLDALT
jgi:L-asparagine transporter-like permease